MSWSCATPRTFDCATLSIIGHALPLSTISRAALATPHCVDAGTHTDARSAVSQTDSLQWRACSCNDRLCLTLFSVRPPHHKAPFLSHPDNRCFSVRLRAVSPSRPAGQHRAAHRRRSRLAVGHRRNAAQCGLDGREHGATLNQVGSGRFLSRHTLRGYRPLLFLLATMVGSPIWIRTSSSARQAWVFRRRRLFVGLTASRQSWTHIPRGR